MNKYFKAFNRFWEDSKNVGKNRLLLTMGMVINFLIYGASPRDYLNFEFYKISRKEKSKFVTMRYSKKIEKKYNAKKNAYIFYDKMVFNKEFKNYVRRTWKYLPEIKYEDFIKLFMEQKRLIFKPTKLSAGDGIIIIKYNENDNYFDLFNDYKDKKYLVEEVVYQIEELSKLNSSSLNTIRIYTLVKNKKTQVIFAGIRMGREGKDVDNYHAGGIACSIDLKTGKINTSGRDIKDIKYDAHPDSGVDLLGFQIPKWEELLKLSEELSLVYEDSRYIAWDIAITKDGFELIEGNYMGDPGLLQSIDKVGKKDFFK